MRTPIITLLLISAAGCSKCGEAPKVTESKKEVAAPAPLVGDLRTGLVNTVPEFRGVNNLNVIAVLERTLATDPSDGGALVDALVPYFEDKRWKRAEMDGGLLIAQQKPFFLEAERVNGAAVVRVGLVIPGEHVVKLLQSPSPMTTQQLAVLMPMDKNTKVTSDVFFFETHYVATDELGTALIKNLIANHVRSGWKILEAPPALLESDAATVASGFKAVLADANATGTLTIGRVGQHTALTWAQPLTP